MPWDSVDKHRDEDASERRLTERRRWNTIRGRRTNDLSTGVYEIHHDRGGCIITLDGYPVAITTGDAASARTLIGQKSFRDEVEAWLADLDMAEARAQSR